MRKPAKKMGRPSKGLNTQLAIRFPDAMIEEIDLIVASRLDAPDRAAVIRELVAEAIEARREAA